MSPTAQTLRERDGELEAIEAAVDATRDGQGQLLIIEGPAGIGKSSLLKVARSAARARSVKCLSARGSELESRFPFGMVHQLLDPLVLPADEVERERMFNGAARLARGLFEDGEPLDRSSSDALYQRLHGLYWLVANLAADDAVAIVFDDAHWADEASLEFISFVARRIEELPLLMVVGTRPVSDQGRAVLAGLTTDPAAVVLRPSPLTRESVDEWVRTVLSNEADKAFVDACHASTSGIPFLVHELLREVASERLQPTAAEARRVGALTPGGVSAVVGLRLANMPSGAVDLARAVAVLGDGTGVGTAAALTDLDEEAAAVAAAALVRAGIVESRNGLTFTHPVVRATVYEGMGPSERSAAHARAAALLRSRLATPDQIAAHLLVTDPSDEPDVVATLTAAARRAADIGALDTARAYLERALAEPPAAAMCADVLTDLGRVEGKLGFETATQRLEQAIDVAPDIGARANAALELARILKFAGEGVRGVEVLDPFFQRVEELEPELAENIKLEYFGLGWLSSGARHRLGPSVIDQPDPGELGSVFDAFVLAAIGFNAAVSGESAELAGERAARAIASERLPADPAYGGYGTLLAAVALMWSDRYGESERQMDRMLREGRRSGNRMGYIAASSMFGLLNMRRGALLDADRDAFAAIELGMEIGRHDAFLTSAYATYGDIGVDRGLPPEQLRRRLGDIEESEHDADALPYALVLLAKARLRIALGDYEQGIEDLLAAGRREVSWGAVNPAVCSWRHSLSLAYREIGDRAAAQQISAEDVGLARRFGAPRPLGMALRAQALAGPPENVVDGLREAVVVLERSAARLELARALVDLGTEMRRAGEGDSAAEILRRGQELAMRCGARGVAQVAHDELLAAGAEPAPLVVTGADLLAPGERRVAEFAARGMDERAIAQEHLMAEATVSERLRSACEALGVADRSGLRVALNAAREATAAGPSPLAARLATDAIDFAESVRDALRDFKLPHRLATNPLAEPGASMDERAESVRDRLRSAADAAFGPAPGEQLMRSVLVRGYLDPAPSHEEAADELHISRSTYFRRLREATDRLAEYLETAAGSGSVEPRAGRSLQ